MTHRFLQEIKAEALAAEWTPQRSEIVDIIDAWEIKMEEIGHDNCNGCRHFTGQKCIDQYLTKEIRIKSFGTCYKVGDAEKRNAVGAVGEMFI